MAARDEWVNVPADGAWHPLFDNDTTGATTVSMIKGGVYVKAMPTATAPSGSVGHPLPGFSAGWANKALADLFSGVDTPVMLYARAIGSEAAIVSVCHAES